MEHHQAMKNLDIDDRLAALRAKLPELGVAGVIVPRGDEHLGEYTPPSAERLAWLTGFTGSAGLAAVLQDRAAVFTDGRYTLQLDAQASGAWERRHMVEDPAPAWLAAHAGGGAIGYDPMLVGEEQLSRYAEAGVQMVPLPENPIDAIWTDRPAPPSAPVVAQPLEFAGRASADKRADVAAELRAAKQDAAVLTDPASIAWLLNVRGADLDFTPFPLSFALLRDDGAADLFIEPAKVSGELRAWLGNQVSVRARDELGPALQALAGKRVRLDPAGAAAWFAQTLRAAGADVAAGPDPCLLPKACKNEAEQRGMRAAHLRDGVAMCRFLHLLSQRPGWTELQAAERLVALRAEAPEFRGESFPAISGAGEHGAIIHYRVTPETDRRINADEVYLIDSGGQYEDGTTDVTRTVWTGPAAAPDELRARATMVLQGHIALAAAVFPVGTAGIHLDALARRALWAAGLDYDHGTGHGVGSYLSVHEGPASISRASKPVPIAEGMVLSDEPGFYLPGAYGIRLENLLLVQPAALPDATKPFLRFETLTLAPFDRELIDVTLLDAVERAWIDAYHARVLAEIGPALPPDAAAWLQAACAKLPV
jgi:Xaa-Pro aminopeptidase